MKGQWRGRYESNVQGDIILELDEFPDCYRGCAYLYGPNPSLPGTCAIITIPTKETRGAFRTLLLPLHPDTLQPVAWETIADSFPEAQFANHADVEFNSTDTRLELSWRTRHDIEGRAVIERQDPSRPSDLVPRSDVTTWEAFKQFAVELDHGRFIFRGQAKPWRLRTSFHRTGRADLYRYSFEDDIPHLHRNLSARTRHFYDLKDPSQNGAFYNLVQHHGYPTPLMDWTYSPFVGAFFAYKSVTNAEAVRAADDIKVRVLVFDEREWRSHFGQVQNLNTRHPHFSVLKALAIGNERMVPQQALSTLTNVDDIEAYIRTRELERNVTYLQAIDLPASSRSRVMQELSLMGITAGSMFPGLDGACEELRERFFTL